MNRLTTIAAVFALVLTSTLTAQAHVDPADVAERCVNHVDGIVERCQNVIADETHDCVMEIRRLLRAGRDEAAAAVARECLQSGREHVRVCSNEITDTCIECVRYLVNVGANQLARRVYHHCGDAIDGFDVLLARQEEILYDALNGQ